jgi:hypothetical protein
MKINKLLLFLFLTGVFSALKAQDTISTNLYSTTDSVMENNTTLWQPDTSVTQLWNKLIEPSLKDSSLWEKGKAYNAGHFYMVPLHIAFQHNQENWQQQFAQHFKRYAEDGFYMAEPTRLYRLQYQYLASWFLVLAVQHKKDSLIPTDLYNIIYDDIDRIWNVEPAWTWKNNNLNFEEFENMRSRIIWKLYNVEMPPNTFYRAIVDEEKFVFAIAANLKTYLKLTEGDTIPKNEMLDDILQINKTIFDRRVVWNKEGGWLFQPGIWHDHIDYAYAGNISKDNPKKLSVLDIAEDVSHSHRTALWLRSFVNASESEEMSMYYDSLLKGLEYQFFNKVLVSPNDSINTYLTTNFMDGYNGVYRWNYNGLKNGYGPFELSGTMLIGWWAFLGSNAINNIYKELATRFPLPEKVLSIYEARTNEPRPADKAPNFYITGFAELMTRLAAALKTAN